MNSSITSDEIRVWKKEHLFPHGKIYQRHPLQSVLVTTALDRGIIPMNQSTSNELNSKIDSFVQELSVIANKDYPRSECGVVVGGASEEDNIVVQSLRRNAAKKRKAKDIFEIDMELSESNILSACSLVNELCYPDSTLDAIGSTATHASAQRVDVSDKISKDTASVVTRSDRSDTNQSQTDSVRNSAAVVMPPKGSSELPSAASKITSAALNQKYRPYAAVKAMQSTGNGGSSGTVPNSREQGNEPRSNPFKSAKEQLIEEGGTVTAPKASSSGVNKTKKSSAVSQIEADSDLPPELAIFDKNLIEKIEADIIHQGSHVTFDDIAGLEFAKKCVFELICWPMSRPDLFQGLRALPKGILLFGPPGTGKTLIGKAIACEVGATFFSISASSLTSKWIGEGEKTVRALFALAVYKQPSVVFVDEVDSLLCQRSSDENEASRRIKTEFLVQLDGAGTSDTSRVVIIGATNRPEEIDEAARRRFVKRIYIPLPDVAGRQQLLQRLLGNPIERAAGSSAVATRSATPGNHTINSQCLATLVSRTEGFSGADIRALCSEAAMGPIREITSRQQDLLRIQAADVPPINMTHFEDALEAVAPSVSPGDLQRYLDWNAQFGSFRKTA